MRYQISYFPYLFQNQWDKVDFNGITIWHFQRFKGKYINNVTLRKHISKLLSANVRLGKELRDIFVISIEGKKEFIPFSPKERKRIENLRKVLFLCAVAGSNIDYGRITGFSWVTADNFAVVTQNFDLSPFVSYSTGKIVKVTDGGYKINEIKFEVPRHVLSNRCELDEKLLEKLEKVKNRKKALYRRIIRATDAMMNGYSNADDLSHESRILQQSRGFEFLFDLPEKKQRKYFKDNIEKYCALIKERRIKYKYIAYGKSIPETGTRQKMWADRFYSLRNKIIHGEAIRDKDFLFFDQPHWQLALLFFICSVKQIINESFGKKYFNDTVRVESRRFVYDKMPLRVLVEQAYRDLMSKRKSRDKNE